jgi:hypothetical protein
MSRQGIHRSGAEKSTSTGCLLASTTLAKVLSVTVGAFAPWQPETKAVTVKPKTKTNKQVLHFIG